MKWFYQDVRWGLGNFVMATPALRLKSANDKANIKVFFGSPHVGDLFDYCPFIKRLHQKPAGPPTMQIRCPKRHAGETDAEAWCRILCGHIPKPMPNTYVDRTITKRLNKVTGKRYIAIFHGCLNMKAGPIAKKDIGGYARQHMINAVLNRSMIPVLLGSVEDLKRFWCDINTKKCVNYVGKLSLKDSTSILAQCDNFMSNDTGLYHVAGALEVPGLVIWRKTDMLKNRAVFGDIKHVVSKDIKFKHLRSHIDKYLDSL